jgi:uncharacterized protein (TIGR02996 family)
MSATLRYDIPRKLANAIIARTPGLAVLVGMRETLRWAGVRRGGNTAEVATFAVKLPKQIAAAWELIRMLECDGDVAVIRGAITVRDKLALSIGLNVDHCTNPNIFPEIDEVEEEAFFDAIKETPGDLATWSAYSDWLQEQDRESMQLRGRLIAGWLGKKAIKVKYGIPVMVRPETLRRNKKTRITFEED